MYLFFNREKEPFRMEKGRSLVTNIDRKGKWRLDTGGDKKKLTMLKRGCSLFCGYCLLFCGNRKKHRLKRKNGMRKKTGIKYKTWILKFDIYTKLWTRQKMKCTPKVRHKTFGVQFNFDTTSSHEMFCWLFLHLNNIVVQVADSFLQTIINQT